ncbi:hypothetical protein EI555_020245 [Monodon monoceros]|uniref:Iroquois-class homeodomain protein domain-containing protein n=1 Tax=Monodon monoceros TaxID=40151 RepID=A0A4U1ERM0_MONMO|nr:hypothetical protein EI555_020245 [Monodon monoceros]
MSYPQGYLYQAPGSLALYSCPAYGASALAAPRSEELARSASGSAFSPYPGSAAFTAQAATGFGSPLQYSADAAAAAAGFPSYMAMLRKNVSAGVWPAKCRLGPLRTESSSCFPDPWSARAPRGLQLGPAGCGKTHFR